MAEAVSKKEKLKQRLEELQKKMALKEKKLAAIKQKGVEPSSLRKSDCDSPQHSFKVLSDINASAMEYAEHNIVNGEQACLLTNNDVTVEDQDSKSCKYSLLLDVSAGSEHDIEKNMIKDTSKHDDEGSSCIPLKGVIDTTILQDKFNDVSAGISSETSAISSKKISDVDIIQDEAILKYTADEQSVCAFIKENKHEISSLKEMVDMDVQREANISEHATDKLSSITSPQDSVDLGISRCKVIERPKGTSDDEDDMIFQDNMTCVFASIETQDCFAVSSMWPSNSNTLQRKKHEPKTWNKVPIVDKKHQVSHLSPNRENDKQPIKRLAEMSITENLIINCGKELISSSELCMEVVDDAMENEVRKKLKLDVGVNALEMQLVDSVQKDESEVSGNLHEDSVCEDMFASPFPFSEILKPDLEDFSKVAAEQIFSTSNDQVNEDIEDNYNFMQTPVFMPLSKMAARLETEAPTASEYMKESSVDAIFEVKETVFNGCDNNAKTSEFGDHELRTTGDDKSHVHFGEKDSTSSSLKQLDDKYLLLMPLAVTDHEENAAAEGFKTSDPDGELLELPPSDAKQKLCNSDELTKSHHENVGDKSSEKSSAETSEDNDEQQKSVPIRRKKVFPVSARRPNTSTKVSTRKLQDVSDDDEESTIRYPFTCKQDCEECMKKGICTDPCGASTSSNYQYWFPNAAQTDGCTDMVILQNMIEECIANRPDLYSAPQNFQKKTFSDFQDAGQGDLYDGSNGSRHYDFRFMMCRNIECYNLDWGPVERLCVSVYQQRAQVICVFSQYFTVFERQQENGDIWHPTCYRDLKPFPDGTIKACLSIHNCVDMIFIIIVSSNNELSMLFYNFTKDCCAPTAVPYHNFMAERNAADEISMHELGSLNFAVVAVSTDSYVRAYEICDIFEEGQAKEFYFIFKNDYQSPIPFTSITSVQHSEGRLLLHGENQLIMWDCETANESFLFDFSHENGFLSENHMVHAYREDENLFVVFSFEDEHDHHICRLMKFHLRNLQCEIIHIFDHFIHGDVAQNHVTSSASMAAVDLSNGVLFVLCHGSCNVFDLNSGKQMGSFQCRDAATAMVCRYSMLFIALQGGDAQALYYTKECRS